MKQSRLSILLLLFVFLTSSSVYSQFKDFGLKGGIQINGVMPATEFEDDNGLALSSYLLRGFLRFELSDLFNAELGAGYGMLQGDDYNNSTYETTIIPIDIRLVMTPFNWESMNPYIYAGFGALNFNVSKLPVSVTPQLPVKKDGWTGVIPFGIGTEIKLSDQVLLDISAGLNYSLTENLNYYRIEDFNDGYINIGAGISFTGESMNSDKDQDGLTKREELELGTDPDNPDSDGDGLKDGDEVKKYNTDPLKADSDGDGLKDGEEVLTYKTNPNNVDTDGDGLSDGDEILKYKTDPLKADTDGDGLNDGDELNKYKTNPLKVDTDGDGLSDGDEVLKHKTDPLKADTDGGGVQDGEEVKRGTDPLDPSDDLPKAVTEKELTFENIHFAFDSFKLSRTAQQKLDAAYEALKNHSDAKITLGGHTDSIGSDEYNMKLSERRANAAKDYLVKKGLNAANINTEWFGKSKPVAANDTDENRALNRRVEIKAKVMEKE